MYAGKYMNMYGLPAAGGVEQVPAGWDSWQGLVSRVLTVFETFGHPAYLHILR